MGQVVYILLLFPLLSYAVEPLNLTLCARGQHYQLEMSGQKVKLTKNGTMILNETYVDLQIVQPRELSEIKEAFRIYFHVQDIVSAIRGTKTRDGENKTILLGKSRRSGAFTLLVGDNADELGYTWMCF